MLRRHDCFIILLNALSLLSLSISLALFVCRSFVRAALLVECVRATNRIFDAFDVKLFPRDGEKKCELFINTTYYFVTMMLLLQRRKRGRNRTSDERDFLPCTIRERFLVLVLVLVFQIVP